MKNNLKHLFLLFLFVSLLSSCTDNTPNELQSGLWKGELQLQGQQVPLSFRIENKENQAPVVTLINGKEELLAGEATIKDDSVIIPMHIFDTEIRAHIGEGRLKGYWVKNYVDDYIVPFQAQHQATETAEANTQASNTDINGKWRVTFSDDKPQGPPAIGIFEQKDGQLYGTFMTTTGDYRYLTGDVEGNKIMLSTFNGENAYLFKAELINENEIKGTFWSGKSREESWTAVRDENVSLPDANTLTYLKDGYDRLAFTFPNLDKEMVSLSDEKYQDKVVLVQLFGTWCPNCMDETSFLADWYRQNKERGLEIIGLAYEKKDDFGYAKKRVQKMVDRYDVGYDFLIAGTSDKGAAAKTLPMLNHVMSFPTLIFIDRQGNVRKIHTGFSGPSTGEYFEKWAEEFKTFTDKLIEENQAI